MLFGKRSKVAERVERTEGMPLGEALRFLYIEQKMSTQSIADRWSISIGFVSRMMKYFSIDARKTAKGCISAELLEKVCRIEDCTIEELPAIAFRLYIEDLITTRQLCDRWKVNNRSAPKILKHLGIKIRNPSEAVKTQWVNNPERRELSREVMRKNATEMSRQGRHPRLGKTKETDEGVRKIAEKLKTSTSAKRPEVMKKITEARIKRFRANPSEHPNAKVKPTRAELMMIAHLQNMGFEVVHNHYIEPYWIDVYIPSLQIGIECFSVGRTPFDWARISSISGRGINLLYVVNRYVYDGKLADLDEYILLCQRVGSNPTSQGQKTVIWGRQRLANTIANHPNNLAAVGYRVNGCYRLDIAATPDD